MNPTTSFTTNMMFQFISAYKDQDLLWNMKNPNYSNTKMRATAIENIVRHMDTPGLTAVDVCDKIHYLRTAYAKIRKQVVKSIQPDDPDASPTYRHCTYWYEKADEFLRCIEDYNRSKRGMKLAEQNESEENEVAPFQLNVPNRKEPNAPIKTYGRKLNRKKKKQDQFEIFGRAVATTLKQMPVCEARKLQQKLQDAINKRGLSSLQGSSSDNKEIKEEILSNLKQENTCVYGQVSGVNYMTECESLVDGDGYSNHDIHDEMIKADYQNAMINLANEKSRLKLFCGVTDSGCSNRDENIKGSSKSSPEMVIKKKLCIDNIIYEESDYQLFGNTTNSSCGSQNHIENNILLATEIKKEHEQHMIDTVKEESPSALCDSYCEPSYDVKEYAEDQSVDNITTHTNYFNLIDIVKEEI